MPTKDELEATVKDLQAQVAAKAKEFEDFKHTAISAARELAEAHDWCDEVDKKLIEVGILEESRKVTVAFDLPVEVTVETRPLFAITNEEIVAAFKDGVEINAHRFDEAFEITTDFFDLEGNEFKFEIVGKPFVGGIEVRPTSTKTFPDPGEPIGYARVRASPTGVVHWVEAGELRAVCGRMLMKGGFPLAPEEMGATCGRCTSVYRQRQEKENS